MNRRDFLAGCAAAVAAPALPIAPKADSYDARRPVTADLLQKVGHRWFFVRWDRSLGEEAQMMPFDLVHESRSYPGRHWYVGNYSHWTIDDILVVVKSPDGFRLASQVG